MARDNGFAADSVLNRHFGRLTVLEKILTPKRAHSRYWCLCECGSETIVQLGNLKNGHTSSCGCIHREMMTMRHQTHGMSNSKEYQAWSGMITRTTNPKNKRWDRYGARGITMCDEWRLSFEQFIKDMGSPPSPKHQLDRIDNNQGYYPENCRWVLQKENARNTCANVFVEHNGQRKTVAEWSEITGIGSSLLRWRLKVGWGVHRAFTEQAMRGKNQSYKVNDHG